MTMPTVAVLPFSAEAGGAGIGRTLADEVKAALVPFRTITVIAPDRNPQFAVRGSVRRRDGREVITARLIDTATGANLWARSFGGEVEPDVAGAVAAAVESRIHLHDLSRQLRGPPT